MGLTVQQFVKNLTDSGVLSLDEMGAILDTVAQEGVNVDAGADAQPLAEELVRRQELTDFQVRRLTDSQEGLTLGSYLVLDEIGRGGMGRVYKAEHRRMKRLVALKVLSASAMQSPKSIKRFQREVEAAAKLNHPNIVAAYDADEENGIHYLVMEYVEGMSLADRIQQEPLSLPTAMNYVLQIAYGLRYAHEQGVVHRDIKPANVLVTNAGVAKVLDMGLARFDEAPGDLMATDRQKLTQAGQIMGTVDYMSPEQAEDTHQADARSDIYSLGCTLYYLLIGEAPYAGDTVMRKLLAHRNQPIPSLQKQRPDVSRELDGIFQKMVAKQPAGRYQSMAEVIVALEGCVASPTQGPASGMLKHAFGSGILSKPAKSAAEAPDLAAPDSDVLSGLEFAPDSWPIVEEELMFKEDAERLDLKAPAKSAPAGPGTLIKVACRCGQKFAVKSEYAGKKVKCRGCGEALSVPSSALSVIPLKCKQCGKRLTASAKLAGKTVKCSQCSALLKIPANGVPDSTLTNANPPTQTAAPLPAAKIRITCRCGKKLNVGSQFAGKSVKCPDCAAPIKVPK